jgi:hypothetical protein
MICAPLVYTALACERFGMSDDALAYAAAVLERDVADGGSELPSARTFAYMCRGRMLAARGALAPAETAFDAAVEEAEGARYGLLACFALRDRIEHCGDPRGELQARLDATVQTMLEPAAVAALLQH